MTARTLTASSRPVGWCRIRRTRPNAPRPSSRTFTRFDLVQSYSCGMAECSTKTCHLRRPKNSAGSLSRFPPKKLKSPRRQLMRLNRSYQNGTPGQMLLSAKTARVRGLVFAYLALISNLPHMLWVRERNGFCRWPVMPTYKRRPRS